MPELPEVETMVRGIRPHVEGRKITKLVACPNSCRPLSIVPGWAELVRGCQDQVIRQVIRRAKRVVLELGSGKAISLQPRMTGLVLLADFPDRDHLRLEWKLDGKSEYQSLWFWDQRGLGVVTLHTAEEYARLLTEGALGRDALRMELEDWQQFVRKTSRPIKVALLDQKLVAGIGNLYASEILHRAKIHPATVTNTLTKSQIARLAECTRFILEEAIRYEGSTLSDGTYRNTLNQSGGYQNAHQVYDRAGEPCRACTRGTVQRVVQAQRSTFFCPVCQKAGKR